MLENYRSTCTRPGEPSLGGPVKTPEFGVGSPRKGIKTHQISPAVGLSSADRASRPQSLPRWFYE